IMVCEKETTDFGQYLTFETLTLFPFDLNSIEKKLLSPDETKWINDYHQTIYEKLAPWLNETECNWLKQKTGKI
ncbi:MAG: M24 family metallopeptidase C-terminal domain-containing protein, partial [Bacteroidales bacterium]|nr:M24 family metallopeptidase C-terminal domain-containing protein [Bacteroidales bacterium]